MHLLPGQNAVDLYPEKFQIDGEPGEFSLPKPKQSLAKALKSPSDQKPGNLDDLQDSRIDFDNLDEFSDLDLDTDLGDLNDL